MADQFTPRFEHEALEADLRRLAAEVRGHRDRPEGKTLSGQELVKKSLQSLPPAVPQEPPATGSNQGPLPQYAQDAPAGEKMQVEYLLDLAFHKGIFYANTEARKASPFVLDAFHDTLAGKLYPELKKRGLVE